MRAGWGPLGCSLTCGTGRRGWNACMEWGVVKRNEAMKGRSGRGCVQDTRSDGMHTCPLTNRTYTQTTLYHACRLPWQSFKLLFFTFNNFVTFCTNYFCHFDFHFHFHKHSFVRTPTQAPLFVSLPPLPSQQRHLFETTCLS